MTRRRSPATSTDGPPANQANRFAALRAEMVQRQLRGHGVNDESVLSAMATIPRERFVPPGERTRAYDDCALPIGGGQTISQPWIVARMCELLELDGSGTVLEVGGGSGYAAAVMSMCADRVVTIERDSNLADRARDTLADLDIENVDVRTGDGCAGAPGLAPFERIAVAATATDSIPPALIRQLTPEGIIVCPVRRNGAEELVRSRGGVEESIAAVRFVPLVAGATS